MPPPPPHATTSAFKKKSYFWGGRQTFFKADQQQLDDLPKWHFCRSVNPHNFFSLSYTSRRNYCKNIFSSASTYSRFLWVIDLSVVWRRIVYRKENNATTQLGSRDRHTAGKSHLCDVRHKAIHIFSCLFFKPIFIIHLSDASTIFVLQNLTYMCGLLLLLPPFWKGIMTEFECCIIQDKRALNITHNNGAGHRL